MGSLERKYITSLLSRHSSRCLVCLKLCKAATLSSAGSTRVIFHSYPSDGRFDSHNEALWQEDPVEYVLR